MQKWHLLSFEQKQNQDDGKTKATENIKDYGKFKMIHTFWRRYHFGWNEIRKHYEIKLTVFTKQRKLT